MTLPLLPPQSLAFRKYHGLGNDYLVVEPTFFAAAPAPADIRALCDRNLGVGSDGVLVGPTFVAGEPHLRIFNPDGSEAEKSGNGVRIFARYLCDRGLVGDDFTIMTAGGRVRCRRLDAKGRSFSVEMGEVTFMSNEIPVAGPAREVVDEPLAVGGRTFRVTCVGIGNPHCVIPLAEIGESLAREIGPQVEAHPSFPNRINVQLMKALGHDTIEIRIWERGAGYTLASGSSSCAAAAAARRLGLVGDDVRVLMPGGELAIAFRGRAAHMTGPVEAVCSGVVAEDLAARLGSVAAFR